MSNRDIKKKSNTKNNKPKVKQKFTLAKNKNEAILAIVVVTLFILFSLYNLFSYIKSQQVANAPAPAASTAQNQEMMAGRDPGNPHAMEENGAPQNMDPNNPNQPQQAQMNPNQAGPNSPNSNPADPLQNNPNTKAGTQPPVQNSAPVAATSSGINPIVPILIILLVAGGAYGAYRYFPKNSAGAPGSGFNSGANSLNKNGKKEKFSIAKNKNEAILAIVVSVIFVLYSGYNVFNYISTQTGFGRPAPSKDQIAEAMAKNQQKNLQSLGKNPAGVQDPNAQQDANDIYSKTLEMQGKAPGSSMPPNQMGNLSQGGTNGEDIEIMSRTQARGARARSGKMVMIAVADSGRSNPFLPAAENVVPSSLPKFNLTQPPETVATGSDADNVMGTTISGILYDKYSPSAIINIGGTDYLVKRGDVINRYKILTINKDQVTVQLGKNIYKAGVGQILAQSPVNFNTISNLNKKFAGNSVSVGVRKKGY